MTSPLLTSVQTKHFRTDFPSQRENNDATLHGEIVVQEEPLDIHEASSARCRASGKFAVFLRTTRKPLSREEVNDLVAIIHRSMQLVGYASTTLTKTRRVAPPSKVNKARASLDKENFMEAGRDLFGQRFDSCQK